MKQNIWRTLRGLWVIAKRIGLILAFLLLGFSLTYGVVALGYWNNWDAPPLYWGAWGLLPLALWLLVGLTYGAYLIGKDLEDTK